MKISDKVTVLSDENKPEEVVLYKLDATYIQPKDCWDDGEEDQEIKIEVHNCTNDENQMFFTIETKRWAFNNLEELTDLFNNFKKRLRNE